MAQQPAEPTYPPQVVRVGEAGYKSVAETGDVPKAPGETSAPIAGGTLAVPVAETPVDAEALVVPDFVPDGDAEAVVAPEPEAGV